MKTNKFIAAQIFLPLIFCRRTTSAKILEFTSFPLKFSQNDCPQAAVGFPDSKSVFVSAGTSASKADCFDVKAGRGVKVTVPAGTESVTAEITIGRYALHTLVRLPYFGYGRGFASTGIMVSGLIVGSPHQTHFFRHKYSEAEATALGGDSNFYEATDAVYKCTLQPLIPSDYQIFAYVSALADTDGGTLSAFARSDAENIKKIKVTIRRQ